MSSSTERHASGAAGTTASPGIAATGVIAEQVGRVIAEQVGRVIADEPGMCVTAVGSRDLSRARRLAERLGAPRAYGGYAELVADPTVQAVYVATPQAQHRMVVDLAIAAGKAVLCEKPLRRTLADMEALITRARQANVFLMEGMWMYFNPLVQQVRSLVHSGELVAWPDGAEANLRTSLTE